MKAVAIVWGTVLLTGAACFALAVYETHLPHQITVEQQNRVMRAQIRAYQAAIEWKYGELAQWEAGGVRKSSLSPTEMKALQDATSRTIAGKKALDAANNAISALEREIRKEDRCEKCKLNPGEFQWAK